MNDENIHHHIHVDEFPSSTESSQLCEEDHHNHHAVGGQHAHQDVVIQTCFSSSHQNGATPLQHRHLHLDLYTPSLVVSRLWPLYTVYFHGSLWSTETHKRLTWRTKPIERWSNLISRTIHVISIQRIIARPGSNSLMRIRTIMSVVKS